VTSYLLARICRQALQSCEVDVDVDAQNWEARSGAEGILTLSIAGWWLDKAV
tara:strand:+ start:469 stop:624 length:156 start_codon:yes stop_codon:yes gene_type:complete